MEEKVQIEKEDKIIEERKQKVVNFFKTNPSWIFYIILIALVIFGVYMRMQPMADHGGGTPGLWDVTTNDWTLGPDLDPFLFLRYAKEIIEHGWLPNMDAMRNVPLGFDPTEELQMVSYMIVLTYKALVLFGKDNINYAGVLMPVIFFALIIIAFFFFAREIFYRKDEKETHIKSWIIASIATLLMIVVPVFVPRTVAGIPEKESIAFFFMFAAFYFFLKGWKSEKLRGVITHGILAGIFTVLMGLSWGGSTYLYFTISVSCFAAFILNKFNKNRFILLAIWTILSPVLTLLFTSRYSLKSFLFGLDTMGAVVTLAALIVHYIIWNTKIKNIGFFEKTNLPKHIVSLIITIVLGLIGVTILQGPQFIIGNINNIKEMMFNPVTGRWRTTVAENRQPFFSEWGADFGPFLKNIPVLFWLFFAGSVVLVKKMLSKLEKQRAWTLTGLYVLFFFGLVFSRISPTSTMNGENAISKAFYYLSALALICGFVYFYIKEFRENKTGFNSIDYEYLLLFVLLVLCLFTARAAVRLIMVLAPIAPIFLAYLLTESIFSFKKMTDQTMKTIMVAVIIVIILLSLFTFVTFYKQSKAQAYGSVPYYYTLQWQKAMAWVRDSTPTTAVFAHWWDYGYWVQSIGERATVTDGGNLIIYWNYLTGRHVLTGESQKTALEFLYSHDTTHLLIDSSDLGKYGAFSQIGSDINYDKLSYGPPTMVSDIKQTQETANGTIRIYQGSSVVDEDINYKDNDTSIFLPGFSIGASGVTGYNAGIIGLIVEIEKVENSSDIKFKQPEAVYAYQNKQIKIPLKYLYYNGTMNGYNTGIEAAIYIIPRVMQGAQGLQLDGVGAAIYVSPRVLRGLLGQLYILDDPFKKFDAFKLVHTENSIIVDSLLSQKAQIGEWTYFDSYGLQGPIKIWKINYKGDEKVNPTFVQKEFPAEVNWRF